MSDSNVFWILVAVAVILLAYFYCGNKGPDNFLDMIKQNLGMFRKAAQKTNPQVIPVSRKQNPVQRGTMLEVEHNDPLLVTLFARDVQVLPDGMSQAQFDNLVTEYHDRNLKEREIVIPRNLNFNYTRHVSETDKVNKAVTEHYKQFVSRGDVGGITDKIVRGVSTTNSTLHPRVFNKKTSKR
jgi:hypothetical protein